MIIVYQQARELGAFLRSRIFAVSLLFVMVASVICQIAGQAQSVYVVTEQNERSVHFVIGGVERLREKFQIPGGPENGANLMAASDFEEEDQEAFVELSAQAQIAATIVADGKFIEVQAPNGTTVGELLYQQEIRYNGNDIVTPDPTMPLEHGDEIVLQRVEYEEFTEEETIPYDTIRKNSSLVQTGTTKLAQEGQEGVLTTTYLECTVDGEQEELQVLGERVSRRPKDEVVLVGTTEPVSPLDFDLEVDENGKPLHFKQLLKNQVATGYSARPGALTASGRYAVVGHVAVNPNVIPYGSKLYITSEDGRFIYGCAIAADTGTGLMQDIVDVDLFYETYIESAMNGRKYLDIYVLE